MPSTDDNKDHIFTVEVRSRGDSSDSSMDSSEPSLSSPRTARFAEATTVNSPIEPSQIGRSPFADPSGQAHQPSDVGFGYVHGSNEKDRIPSPAPLTPMRSPLKSAMKSPGAAPRHFDTVLSPTFREEQAYDKEEEKTAKEQAKDLKVKVRVRMAKMILRGVNFSCSLIVVSMLAAVFSIFNATRHIPPRNNLPPWAANTKTWPQITLLVIACVSLLMSIIIFYAYWRGGHRRAEKVAVYYTTFAVVFFIFSIVMWGIGLGILNQSKVQGEGQDLWGWSCRENMRRELFKDDVAYGLACRLQDWALVCCIIEIVVETLTISLYGIVFYRYYTKRRLRKSMAIRDRVRSDMYLAQLRSQSAPNTPGLNGPLSPRDGGWRPPPGHTLYRDPHAAAEEGESDSTVQYPRGFANPKPFTLQPPPIRVHAATPKVSQAGFDSGPNPTFVSSSPSPPSSPPLQPPTPMSPSFFLTQLHQEHVPAAPGEVQYAPVPIPEAYASPVSSPSFAPAQLSVPTPVAQLPHQYYSNNEFSHFDFQSR